MKTSSDALILLLSIIVVLMPVLMLAGFFFPSPHARKGRGVIHYFRHSAWLDAITAGSELLFVMVFHAAMINTDASPRTFSYMFTLRCFISFFPAVRLMDQKARARGRQGMAILFWALALVLPLSLCALLEVILHGSAALLWLGLFYVPRMVRFLDGLKDDDLNRQSGEYGRLGARRAWDTQPTEMVSVKVSAWKILTGLWGVAAMVMAALQVRGQL